MLTLILIIGLNVKSFLLGGRGGGEEKKAKKKTKIEKAYKIRSITFKRFAKQEITL